MERNHKKLSSLAFLQDPNDSSVNWLTKKYSILDFSEIRDTNSVDRPAEGPLVNRHEKNNSKEFDLSAFID